MTKKLILVIIFSTSIFISFIFMLDQNTQKGYKYIIKEGYIGKLIIIYNVKNELPFSYEDGYQIVKFPSNGIVKTSSKPILGKSKDKYFFYTNDNIIVLADDIKLGGGMSIENNNSFRFEFWVSLSDKPPNKYEETNNLP